MTITIYASTLVFLVILLMTGVVVVISIKKIEWKETYTFRIEKVSQYSKGVEIYVILYVTHKMCKTILGIPIQTKWVRIDGAEFPTLDEANNYITARTTSTSKIWSGFFKEIIYPTPKVKKIPFKTPYQDFLQSKRII